MEEWTQSALVLDVPPCQEEIGQLIDRIRSSYSAGCLRLTGEPLPESNNRRVDRRSVIDIPFYLRPVDAKGREILDEHAPAQLAVTRDLSPRGIGLQSDHPLKERYYVAEFDCPRYQSVRFLIEVRWQTRRSPHNYVAGCWIVCQWDQ